MCKACDLHSSEENCSPLSESDSGCSCESSTTVVATKKSVRFSAEPSEVYTVLSRDDYEDEEIDACWWSDFDCKCARQHAMYIANAAKKSRIISLLEETYMHIQDEVFEREQDQIEEYVLHPPAHLTRYLEKWSVAAHSVRGLERWTSGKQKALRGIDARNARDLVFELYFENELSDSEIAEAYAEYAKTSKVYARMAGYADALAAQKSAYRIEGNSEPRTKQASSVKDKKNVVHCDHDENETETITKKVNNIMISSKAIQQLIRSSTPAPVTPLMYNGVSCKAA